MRKFKKVLSLILCLCLVFSMVPLEVKANEKVVATWEEFKSALKDTSITTISISGDITQPVSEVVGDNAFVINKDVIINGNGNSLVVNSGGIILGGDVTFKNIKIGFLNSVRNAIIANGNTLTLDRVTNAGLNINSLHLFSGGITSYSGTNGGEITSSGDHGQIIIKGSSQLGNIYAGSLCDTTNTQNPVANDFTGNVTITIESDASGIGKIYGHGAYEDRSGGNGDLFINNASLFQVSGAVQIVLKSGTLNDIDGNTGEKGASVLYSSTSDYQYSPKLYNLSKIIVEDGYLSPGAGSNFFNGSLSVTQEGKLDISNYGNLSVNQFAGGGKLILSASQTLTITGEVIGTTQVGIGGFDYSGGSSSKPQEGQTYIQINNGGTAAGTEFEFAQNSNFPELTPVYGNNSWSVPSASGSGDRITFSSITLENSYTATTSDSQIIIPVNAVYKSTPDLYWGQLAYVPLFVFINDGRFEQASQNGNAQDGYTYQTSSLLITPSVDNEDNSKDVLYIEPSKSLFFSEGSYEFTIQVPSIYMEDGSQENLKFTLNITGESVIDPVPISVDPPKAVSGLTYNGTAQIGVSEGDGYRLTGHTATEAGDYEATAVLVDGYSWRDGSTVEQRIPWSISRATGMATVALTGWTEGKTPNQPVSKSDTHDTTKVIYEYKVKGAENTAYTSFDNVSSAKAGNYVLRATFAQNTNYKELQVTTEFTIKEAEVTTDPVKPAKIKISVPKAVSHLVYNKNEQTGVIEGEGYTLTGNKQTNAGKYEATATLNTGYEWADGSADTVKIPWEIAKATGVATVTLENWMVGTKEKKPIPKSDTYSTTEGVTYEYKPKGEGDGSYKDFIANPPVKAGEYVLRASFAANENYLELQVETTFTIEDIPSTAVLERIEVTAQPVLEYKEGASLDLSPMVVTASYDNGEKIILTYNSEGVDVSLQNGIPLTVDEHNGKSILISYGNKTAETDPLMVIPDGIWVKGIVDLDYTGTAQKQTFTVHDGFTQLKEGKDYSVSYKNNKNAYTLSEGEEGFNQAKCPQVILKMKGNYSGTKNIYFRIRHKGIDQIDVFDADNLAAIFTGRNLIPKPVVMDRETGKALKLNKDYAAYAVYDSQNPVNNVLIKEFTQFIEANDYTITLVGKGNYSGIRTITYSIKKDAVLMSKVAVNTIPNQKWEEGYKGEDGRRVFCPNLTLSYKPTKTVLIEGEEGDYTVRWDNNDRAGTATVTLIGTGKDANGDGISHVGSIKKTFKILGTDMNKVRVEGIEKDGYFYTGKEIHPSVTLSYQRNRNDSDTVEVLEESKHYSVSYGKNIDKGTATIFFTGKPESGFVGVKKQSFKIKAHSIDEADLSQVQIKLQKEPILFTKGGTIPEVTVTWEGKELKEGTDYALSYRNNKKVYADKGSGGKNAPAVIVKGKGNFTGSQEIYFTILPKPINHDGIRVEAADKVDNRRANNWKQPFKVYDENGKILSTSDYDKNATYWLVRKANGDAVEEELKPTDKTLRIEPGSVIEIRVFDNRETDSYTGGEGDYACGTYRILEKGYDIKSAVIKIKAQSYTGLPVEITSPAQFVEDKVYLKINGKLEPLTLGKDFEVVKGSYVKNIAKGTARVTFRGIGNYGGTKTVSFKIQQRSVEDFWKGKHLIEFFSSFLKQL